MKKICQNCGYENADKNTFCLNCGAKLINTKDEKGPVIQNTEKRYVKSGKIVLTSSKTTTSLAVLAILLSIVAIIFSVLITPALTLSTGSIGLNQLADNSVSSSKIIDGSITDSDINDFGISRIADNSINSNRIVDNSILFNV